MASTVYLRRTERGLVPDMVQDAEELKKFPMGGLLRAKVTNTRSVPHHRRFFAILQAWIDATGYGYDKERLLKDIKLDLGYTEKVKTLSGKVHIIPDSISFEAMDQASFNEFYMKATALLSEVGGFDVEDALKEVG